MDVVVYLKMSVWLVIDNVVFRHLLVKESINRGMGPLIK